MHRTKHKVKLRPFKEITIGRRTNVIRDFTIARLREAGETYPKLKEITGLSITRLRWIVIRDRRLKISERKALSKNIKA
jgi:hypothetical protein